MKGLIVKKNADLFDVRFGEQIFTCVARGSLKKEGVFVGDKVLFDKNNKIIEQILPRKNLLIRPPISNLDTMIIVIAKKPLPDFYLVDKLILFCFVNGINPVLCVNKTDDPNDPFFNEITKIYCKVSKVIKTSAVMGDVKEVFGVMKGICAFAGQSAVGKSSLINAIFNQELEKIGDFAKKVERGKQTTRTVTLYKLGKNFIADTAGFSKLDEELIDLEPNEISRFYPDMIKFIPNCKFRSCLHINTDNCGVVEAVKKGEVSTQRYQNYLKILQIKQNSKRTGKK